MIVAVIPDRFKANQAFESSLVVSDRSKSMSDVRRPTRGIQIKEDTYATLKVMLGNGRIIPLVNAGSRDGVEDEGKMWSLNYSNFMIQAVSEERVEKQQIVETFGEAFIFFFGERPRIITVQGVLMNTFDFNWESEWWFNYDNYLRGTKCVEFDARVYLTYDETMISGYIMSTSSSKNAQDRNHVPFVFQLFVTDYTNISRLGDPSPDQRKLAPVASAFGRASLGATTMMARAGRTDLSFDVSGTPYSGSGISLVEGLMRAGIQTVNTVWQKAQDIANLAMVPINYLDQFLGNVVRVPIGFQGAVVFDETEVFMDKAFGLTDGDVIKYTTKFGDNYDEFVGLSSQYASSATEVGRAQDDIFLRSASLETSNALLEKANEEWAKYGIAPPSGDLAKLMTRVTSNPLGLMLVGAARNWLANPAELATSILNKQLDSAAPIAAGANNIMGGVAVADNLLGQAQPGASQALDRAVGPAATNTMAALQTVSARLNTEEASSVNAFKAFADHTAASIVGGS